MNSLVEIAHAFVVLMGDSKVALIGLLCGVSGGLLGAIFTGATWYFGMRDNTARHLLTEALRIQGLKEAWIVVGTGASAHDLSSRTLLPLVHEFSDEGELALYPVEVRAVLDEPQWSLSDQLFYRFIDGKRTWAVRPKLTEQTSYGSSLTGIQQASRPAILSSRALEELVAWIEQVASARSWKSSGVLLSRRGLQALLPLIPALESED